MVGYWGTRVVFLMANQRSTRVQGICKKLQTVRGAEGQLQERWSGLPLGIFFLGERRVPERELGRVFGSIVILGREIWREKQTEFFWVNWRELKRAGGG